MQPQTCKEACDEHSSLCSRAPQRPCSPAHSLTDERVARPSSADGDIGVSLEEMNPLGAKIAQLKKEMDEAQKAGDTYTVVELMGTLLSLEGAYESEAGEDEVAAGGRARTKSGCSVPPGRRSKTSSYRAARHGSRLPGPALMLAA